MIGAANGYHPTAVAQAPQTARSAIPSPAFQEPDSDDLSLPVPPNTTCRRRGCNAKSPAESVASREGEDCVHHPGQALFHEGSKGWTCCKPRVLEFDEFMKIEGCKRKSKHLFIGGKTSMNRVENLSDVRYVQQHSIDLIGVVVCSFLPPIPGTTFTKLPQA